MLIVRTVDHHPYGVTSVERLGAVASPVVQTDRVGLRIGMQHHAHIHQTVISMRRDRQIGFVVSR